MKHSNLVLQVVGAVILCLSIALTGSASRKEELERAAELAVERAAERVAERAVEKALESGNSSTETETIRVSHSSVRKQDKSWKLPGFVYTPQQRHDFERIAKEREAAELAAKQIKQAHRFYRSVVEDPSSSDNYHLHNNNNNNNNNINNNNYDYKQPQIDFNAFPFRSTPLIQFGGQYRYAPAIDNEKVILGKTDFSQHHSPVKPVIEIAETIREETNFNGYNRPVEHFKVTQKSYPVMYYFYPHKTYPLNVRYLMPLHAIISHINDKKSEELF